MPSILTPFLLRRRLAAAAPFLRGDVLDLGCGGADVISILQPGQAYVGVDWRAEAVRQLAARHPQHTFVQRDLDRQALDLPGRFDTVVLLAVIEHLRRPEAALGQAAAMLRPGGRVVMTSPSAAGNRVHALGARLGLFSHEAAEEHNLIFSRGSMAALAGRCGLELAVYRSFLLGGNQLFVCQAAGGRA